MGLFLMSQVPQYLLYPVSVVPLHHYRPAQKHQNAFFQVFDLCGSAPESGDLWCKSRQLKNTICPPSEVEVNCREAVD